MVSETKFHEQLVWGSGIMKAKIFAIIFKKNYFIVKTI